MGSGAACVQDLPVGRALYQGCLGRIVDDPVNEDPDHAGGDDEGDVKGPVDHGQPLQGSVGPVHVAVE